jgi:hypothetical protein
VERRGPNGGRRAVRGAINGAPAACGRCGAACGWRARGEVTARAGVSGAGGFVPTAEDAALLLGSGFAVVHVGGAGRGAGTGATARAARAGRQWQAARRAAWPRGARAEEEGSWCLPGVCEWAGARARAQRRWGRPGAGARACVREGGGVARKPEAGWCSGAGEGGRRREEGEREKKRVTRASDIRGGDRGWSAMRARCSHTARDGTVVGFGVGSGIRGIRASAKGF